EFRRSEPPAHRLAACVLLSLGQHGGHGAVEPWPPGPGGPDESGTPATVRRPARTSETGSAIARADPAGIRGSTPRLSRPGGTEAERLPVTTARRRPGLPAGSRPIGPGDLSRGDTTMDRGSWIVMLAAGAMIVALALAARGVLRRVVVWEHQRALLFRRGRL